jgi:hypothetical protein
VWHCHILGHEEMDMMRAQVMAVPPQAPSNLTANNSGTLYFDEFTSNRISVDSNILFLPIVTK